MLFVATATCKAPVALSETASLALVPGLHSDFGPANGRSTAKITDFYLMISTGFDKGQLPLETC
jgi:hypothetical protein